MFENGVEGVKPLPNKKVPRMFKDKANGEFITEFVGLRSKLYSYKIDEKETKKCKGIKKSVRNNLKFSKF